MMAAKAQVTVTLSKALQLEFIHVSYKPSYTSPNTSYDISSQNKPVIRVWGHLIDNPISQ